VIVTVMMQRQKQEQLQARANDLSRRQEDLHRSETGAAFAMKYSLMGRYAEVIGSDGPPVSPHHAPLPPFLSQGLHVTLTPGARWAKAADLGDGVIGKLRAKIRSRFGGTIVVFDYNGDGQPDLFLAGAVVEDGKVRDLLLRNDGNNQFTDVTAAAGLA